ncbi:succinylglutamate desuccinylase/aspartoacylase family protein [Aestuariirhabdus sp. Z084]|uniref:succinylglutamate desuccinylase/aspartoacylase family protein n=1 Tax=Aestuariirhabdus haliotis TaxID=2918751 RepID=UPI00201B3A1A|nr:succinylglutamate desuccinylase/aspartoacylase family protein [Aestuariirhabdus haliotis]MCL6416866.1 succinylglutamate desuccinylase/aspartoacylase family protein [Aestuariirhabdus haliotis]MCL6420858.1 succinylglutamate desuccinylase/aspartoacylase family protein [Aestuariirhabdus haliotis]
MSDPLEIAGVKIGPGESKRLELPSVRLYTDTSMGIPVFVTRGKRPGPTLFVSAAIHGDELNGVEIIGRLLKSKSVKKLRGTLISVPIVNVYGVLNQSRYLPDRRDLNRSFPGSSRGTFAGRVANLFLQEIVSKCDYGIDLHTGAIHRSNLPQVRANLDDDETREMARAFGVSVMVNSNLRDGSLRQSASELGVKILLYEAGEALRFDELSIRAGYRGVINVMRQLGMITKARKKSPVEPFEARQSVWVRASESGFISHLKELGDYVSKGDELAIIKDPYGEVLNSVVTKYEGIIIGKQNIPLVQEGEALYHIAYFKKPDGVMESLETMQDYLIPEDTTDPLSDSPSSLARD